MHYREIGRSMLLCLAASWAHAAAAQSVDAEQLLKCTAEADASRRLACYDDAMGKVVSAAEPSVAPAPEARAATATAAVGAEPSPKPEAPLAEFGVQGSELARKRVEEERRDQPVIKSIEATVSKVEQQPRGELLVDLDNGQTWRQKRPESYFPMRVGDQVTITAGRLGSFRMTVKSTGRGTQVTRVK